MGAVTALSLSKFGSTADLSAEAVSAFADTVTALGAPEDTGNHVTHHKTLRLDLGDGLSLAENGLLSETR